MDDIGSKTISYNPEPSDYQHQLREKRRLERLRGDDGGLSPSYSPNPSAHVPGFRIGELKKNNVYNSSSDIDGSDGGKGGGNGGKGSGKGGNGDGDGKAGGNGVKGPWYLDGVFWKRASVVISIIFSIASLILGAFASLRPGDKEHLRGLSLSSSISPITPTSSSSSSSSLTLILTSPPLTQFVNIVLILLSRPNNHLPGNQQRLNRPLGTHVSGLAKAENPREEVRGDVESDWACA
jgi:hypothetical protein